MPCQNCDDNIQPLYIFEDQDGHCDNCGDSDNKCLDKMDARCVIYNYNNCSAPSTLPNLGIPSCTDLKTILEQIDNLIGNGAHVPLIANDSLSIKYTQSGINGHTFTGQVKVSPDNDNKLTIRSNGLYAQDTYKVKVDSADTPDFLEAQIDVANDPLGIVTLTIEKENGKLIITPSIDLATLCQALKTSGCFQTSSTCVAPTNVLATLS